MHSIIRLWVSCLYLPRAYSIGNISMVFGNGQEVDIQEVMAFYVSALRFSHLELYYLD